MKLKHTHLSLFMIIGPLGVLLLQGVYFLIRRDYISIMYNGQLWHALSVYILDFMPQILVLGMAVIASIIANVEHKEDSFKQILATPIHRTTLYLSKLLIGFSYLLVSCLILFAGILIIGYLLDFEDSIPWLAILTVSFFPLLGGLPIFIILSWLSMTFSNQGIVLTVGVLFTVMMTFTVNMPKFIPLTWMSLTSFTPSISILLGLTAGLILTAITTIHFRYKDV